jgi:hypothetical protein
MSCTNSSKGATKREKIEFGYKSSKFFQTLRIFFQYFTIIASTPTSIKIEFIENGHAYSFLANIDL